MERTKEIQEIRDRLADIHEMMWPDKKEEKELPKKNREVIAQIWKVRDEVMLLETKLEKARNA